MSYSRMLHSDSAGSESLTSNPLIPSLMLYQLSHGTLVTESSRFVAGLFTYMSVSWVNVFRIIPEFRILRLILHRETALKILN